MRLFLLECKKIMITRFHLLLLLLFMLLPVVVFQSRLADTYDAQSNPYLHADGSRMSVAEVREEMHCEKLKWTGAMDEAWRVRLEQAYKIACKHIDAHIYDMEKMNALYGKDWYEDYRTHEDSYAYQDDTKGVKKGKKVLYLRSTPLPNYKEDIEDEVVWSIYANYGKTMLVNKPWNSEDGNFGIMYSAFNNESVAAPVYSSNMSKPELQLLKDYMNEQGTFHYGDSKEWFSLLEAYATAGIVLIFWILVISSKSVNKERKQNMLELVSSCSKGGSSLFLSKLTAVTACSLLALLLLILPVTLFAWLSGNLGDMGVNMTDQLNLISVFTYKEGFFISLEVLVLGTVVCAVLGTLASTCLKSSYVSLGFCLLVMLAMKQFSFSWMKLLPAVFMSPASTALRGFTCNLFGHAYFLWKLLPILWIPAILLIGYIALRIYQSRAYQRV